MSELSIMVLCGRAPRHLYVANRLCGAIRVVAIVQEAGSHWTYKKILKLLRPDNLWRKVWRWLRDRKRYAGGGEGKFFFGDAEPRLDRPELISEVPHINHPSVIELADRLRPDIIAVFGTSLIKGALLSRGPLGIVNLHGGLSPEYRGADCTFWALYNGEPEKIGCTLHFIDAGIDTGKLLAHICPEVHEGDNELTLFWRAVRDSAEVYAEAIGRLARSEALGAPQSGKGKLYQVKDRGWHHEQHLAQALHNGLLKNIHLKKRVTWFTVTSSEKEQR
ncbi:formyl transferase [Candidatus Nitrotoga sp. 1052]|uniref:formyl transferase n=1 Tax=Candidatus Nitrotoga sp. 1052 TaxID=2886964 RepID=UPI001EF668A1|nr:formyl transferase [Candidatus Nitrotoga sp. 1052]CAH1079358.1 Formyl_trans_N domain-containing protein [Candidatus Nitrotoga sp. 1052]